MKKNNVAITGLGFITSIGNDKQKVLDSLKNTISGIELYPPFADEKIPVKCMGTIKDFDTSSLDPEDWKFPSQYSVRRDVLRGFSPHVLYAYCAMKQAVEDAKLTPEEISNPDTGMYTASAGSTSTLVENYRKLEKVGVMRSSPMGVVASVVGTLSYNLVSSFKIKGASCGFASACASSAHATGFAYNEIAEGRQKRMFVVGGEDGDTSAILPFAGMRALSMSKDPAQASRPYDKNRDGFVGTGGGVVMVLEDEEIAKARGAKIYARICSWGQGSDGYNVAIPHPEGDGLAGAITQAFKLSEISPEKIEYINTHGTSTSIGDLAELRGIEKAFGKVPSAAISSTKSLTGHGLSLAGVMELAFCALAIDEGFMPASANITDMDEAAKPFNILTQVKAEAPNFVMSVNSGFGGANTAVILQKV